MKTKTSQRSLRWVVLLLLAALPAMPSYARSRRAGSHHGEAWARDRFAAAERMREALNGRPPADRTRRSYQRVIAAYRSVYYGAPTSTKADPSVVAVAETMVEMGRRLDDDKILNDAIGEYRFLRREYPGSKYRCDALFTIGEIYNDDLNDPEHARATFQEFLHRYPHNRLADDAQNAIADIDREAQSGKKAGPERKPSREVATKDSNVAPSGGASGKPDSAANVSRANHDDETAADEAADAARDAPAADSERPAELPSGQFPRVTGIRHWSTPDYTRVAIDLESEVKFASQRISHPDRIFFDLRDTKLASTLVGKSFDVDDGFLKKIRVAQFEPGRTRVVLEVEDLSDYDAFLLPNPYRLIIDIHGKDFHAKGSKIAAARELKEAIAETADVESAPTASAAKTASSSPPPPALPSKNDAAESDSKALRAEAGKAPVSRQDVGDSAKITTNGETTNPRPNAAREVPAVTKVVVDADDDDDTAGVKRSNAGASGTRSASNSTPSRANHRTSSGAKSSRDDPSPGDDAGDDSTPTSSAHGKISSRLNNKAAADSDIREASPTASGERSLIRALGLKIGKIVIDPGHGGHDTGTIGPNGLEEKDLVLEVGRRLGKLLETRLGAEVVYTRKNDTFIPLETRTAIANQQRADLFISIHANSSHDPEARGVETYYLNFTSSPDALEVAARENAVSEKSIYELQDLVKKIALKEKIEESREFAGDVQESLHNGLATKSPGIRDRGVKKAPFIVLIGANMPSILAEISFVSNPGDERRLETSEYRQRIAESLYRGIAKYVNGLSGVKVASKIDHSTGQ